MNLGRVVSAQQMSKGIRISEAAYLELRRRAESEKRTLQAVVDLLVEQTSGSAQEVARRDLKAWLATVRAPEMQAYVAGDGMTLVRKPEAEREAAARATAAKDLAASSEHGAPAAGRTDTSAAGCASTGVPPEGEPRSGGGEAAGTPGSSTTAAPPLRVPETCLCGHPWGDHAGGAGVCALCECVSFLDLEQDLF